MDKALFDAETAVDGAMPTVNLTDAETALCAELAAETGLPPLLVSRFRQMWVTREAPFFAAVSEETDTLACAALAELVRSVARVASEVVSGSMARVMCGAAGAVDFEGFVRGYGRMHARTLRDALPLRCAAITPTCAHTYARASRAPPVLRALGRPLRTVALARESTVTTRAGRRASSKVCSQQLRPPPQQPIS